MTKQVYKISGMDCEACAKNLELDFEDEGVNAKCNLGTETLEINSNQNISPDKVKKIVEDAGLQVI